MRHESITIDERDKLIEKAEKEREEKERQLVAIRAKIDELTKRK